MVQRFALLYGASLATKLGDSSTASKWTSAANSMTSNIQSFDSNGIISEIQRKNDCSVILGSLYGGTPNEFLPNAQTMYPPNNAAVLATANATIAYFKLILHSISIRNFWKLWIMNNHIKKGLRFH